MTTHIQQRSKATERVGVEQNLKKGAVSNIGGLGTQYRGFRIFWLKSVQQ